MSVYFCFFGNFGPLPFGQLCGGTEQLEEKDGIASRETRKGNIVYCLGKQTRADYKRQSFIEIGFRGKYDCGGN